MDEALRKLQKLLPPPKGQRQTKVNWTRLEKHVGLTYPDSFKEYVGVYGSARWFDKFLPFYDTAQTTKEVQAFLKSVWGKLSYLVGNIYDANFTPLEVPLYPEVGGLFPFMADIDGPLYCWLTKNKDPNCWPIYCWNTGPFIVFRNMTVSGVLLRFLQRSLTVLDSDRIRID